MRGLNLKEIMFKSNMNQQGLNIATYGQAYFALQALWYWLRIQLVSLASSAAFTIG